MKFCSACGNTIEERVPESDNRPRFVCSKCQTIHYVNPRIVVGCLPFHEDRVLLCRRAIEPRRGFWTAPGGFLENGEVVELGAARETLEEANARVTVRFLHTVYSIPHISQVHMLFIASLDNLDFFPGPESEATELFTKEEVPWDQIAFSSVAFALRRYFDDPSARNAPYLGAFYRSEPAHT